MTVVFLVQQVVIYCVVPVAAQSYLANKKKKNNSYMKTSPVEFFWFPIVEAQAAVLHLYSIHGKG